MMTNVFRVVVVCWIEHCASMLTEALGYRSCLHGLAIHSLLDMLGYPTDAEVLLMLGLLSSIRG